MQKWLPSANHRPAMFDINFLITMSPDKDLLSSLT
jgi:hypothetical protein